MCPAGRLHNTNFMSPATVVLCSTLHGLVVARGAGTHGKEYWAASRIVEAGKFRVLNFTLGSGMLLVSQLWHNREGERRK